MLRFLVISFSVVSLSSCYLTASLTSLNEVIGSTPVLVGAVDDGVYLNSTTESPLLSWSQGLDPEGVLDHYEVAIGTTPGGANILSWLNVGLVTSYQVTGLNLTGGQLYFPSVRLVNRLGNRSPMITGDGWWGFGHDKIAVDVTTPAPRMASNLSLFGSSVDLSEDGLTMVVGSSGDSLDQNGENFVKSAGAAFVYIKSGGAWVFQQKLVAAGTNARIRSDSFGISVSISGDTIAIGAQGQDHDASGANFITDAGAVYIFTRSAGVWSQQQKIVGGGTNGRMMTDYFGSAVAIHNDTLLVAAAQQDYDATGAGFLDGAGAAYIFTRSAGVWSQQQKVVGSGTNGRRSFDNFGHRVSVDGDTAVVSANGQAYDASGAGFLNAAGAVYVFTRSAGVWSQQQKIAPTGLNARLSLDSFGSSVSVSGDTIAVGAFGQDYDASGANFLSSAGAVYVFTRSAGVWSQQQKIVSSGLNGRVTSDFFGGTLSLSGDTLAVGASGQDYDASGAGLLSETGAVYVFTRTAGIWSQQQKIVATGLNARADNDAYSNSLALSGDALVVAAYQHDYDANGLNFVASAGACFSYLRTAGTWTQEQKLVDTMTPSSRSDLSSASLGSSLAISEDGLTLAAGAPSDNLDENGENHVVAAGAVYIYSRIAERWVLQQKIVASGLNARISSDNFGNSIAISGDTLVVGAYGQDYDATGANLVGEAGALYVFTRSGGVWSQQQKIVATGVNGRRANDQFGFSVAISGETIAVGAHNQDYDVSGANLLADAGAAYVFTRTAGVWSQQQKIVATGLNARVATDFFGYSVALSGDSLAVGAYGQDTDGNGANTVNFSGAVYVFTRTAGVWSQQQKIVATGVNARLGFDSFGQNVSIDGHTLVVTADGQDYDAAGGNLVSGAGAVYVFTRTAGVWSQQQKIVATGLNSRNSNDSFGKSAMVSGNTLVVGAHQHDYDSAGTNPLSNAGAVYVFTRASGVWSQQMKFTAKGDNAREIDDNFGNRVCVVENGNRGAYILGVGSPNHSYNTVGSVPVSKAGAVFVIR